MAGKIKLSNSITFLFNYGKQVNTMRHRKSIVLMSLVSLYLLVSAAAAADKPDKSETPLSYHLLVEKKVSAQAETIACRLRGENNTKELQFLSRPKEEDISLAIKGLDKRLYSVSFEERGFENLAKLGIYLRPKCAIEMKLAKIVPKKYEEGKPWISRGKYSITASWKRPGLPGVEAGKFEVVKKYTPVITDVQQGKNEYPLGIILESSSKTYYWGEPIMLSVHIENNGALPVRLMNYLDHYKCFFMFEKKDAASNKKIEDSTYWPGSITPHATKGWITLLPGEVLSVAIDASEEFKTATEYRASITYLCRPRLYPKDGKPKDPIYPGMGLIFPPDGKPYYTKQYFWASNEIELAISNAPREEQIKEQVKE